MVPDLVVIPHPEHPDRWRFRVDAHARALGIIANIGESQYARKGFHSDWIPMVVRTATAAGASVVFPAEGLIPRA